MGFFDLLKNGFCGKMQSGGCQTDRLNIDGLDSHNIGIFKPITFYDITQFVRKMGKNIPLIVNFLGLETVDAERSLDFVCGAVCALGGRFEKIGDGIYFFAPKNITLNSDKKYKRT